MATSSNFNTSNQYVKYRIVVTEGNYNILTNSSPVNVKVQAWRTNTGYTTYGSGTCYCKINGGSYSQNITSSQKITYNSYTEIFNRTIDIPHNEDGSKTINVSAYISHDVFSSNEQGFDVVLTTIPRASTPYVVGSLKIGEPLAIYSNRVNSNFIHNIYVSWGSQIQNQRIATGIGESFNWTIPKDYANHIPYGVTGTLFITCETYNGSNKVGDKTISVNVSVPDTEEFRPKITDITLWENSGSGVPTTWGAYIQNKSKLSYEVAATGAYSSSINSYNVVVNGTTYNNKAYTTDVLLTKGTNTIVATVTDSRGRTATYSKTFEVLEYIGPTITNFIANRCLEDGTLDDEGEFVKIEINATVPKLNNKNSYSYFLKYKESEDTEFIIYEFDIDESSDDKNFILSKSIVIAADGDFAFDYMFMLADSFIGINKMADIDSVFQLINFHESGKGMAFGKVAKRSNALEVNMPIYDRFDQLIPNGLAEYRTNGVDIDPNTTLSHLILTETNTPNNDGFYYIMTLFYADKVQNQNKVQIAFPYIYSLTQNKRNVYIRQNVGGEWNEWAQI